MTTPPTFPVLLDGYTDLPTGKIANVVTFLEMRSPPSPRARTPGSFGTRIVSQPSTDWFRDLYRRIGGPWLWFSALVMPEARLAAYIASPDVEILTVTQDGKDIGLAEIDFSVAGDAEIITFGVVPEAVGTGAARYLMDETLARAFGRGVQRVWLHTCTFDHPSAVRFYLRAGFKAWKFAIEVSDDPRMTGALPRSAAPHVALIEPP